jgi:hypothetical protein
MYQPALPARPCRCARPLLDDDSCLRCGRWVTTEQGLEPRLQRERGRHVWTPTGVVRALQAFAFFRGRAPMRADWSRSRGKDWPSLETVERLFGSLPAALRAAGIEECRDSA